VRTGKNKVDLLNIVIENIDLVRRNAKADNEIKEQLSEYGVLEGEVQKYFNNPKLMQDIDIRLFGLITEQIYLKTGVKELDIKDWFNKSEITEMHQFYMDNEADEEVFPLTLENVFRVDADVWSCPVDIKTIARLMKANLLYYNYDIQRQATIKKRLDEIIVRPTVNKKNVKEMTSLLLKKELLPTPLAFNGAIRTSDSGEEFIYNNKSHTLTITEGTRLDILDGYHRCLASLEAYSKNPELSFNFTVQFTNWSTSKAQQYQAQLSKATPIPKSRAEELEKSRYADLIVQQLKTESDLKNRVGSDKRLNTVAGEIVNYSVLTKAIDTEFHVKSKMDANDVGDYLVKFFDHLLGYFLERFESRNDSDLLRNNKMFFGYVVLAKRFRDNGIPLKNIKEVLEGIDFDRKGNHWEEYKIIKNGYFTTNAEKGIKKYFDSIELTK